MDDERSALTRRPLMLPSPKEIKAMKREKQALAVRVKDRKLNAVVEANFGKHAPKIIKMLEMTDSDAAITLLKKKLLQTTVDLIPLAEENIRKTESQRGVYQYTALINTAREMIVDIQADYDKQSLIEDIAERVMRPIFMDVAHEIITKHHDFKNRVANYIEPDRSQRFSEALQDLATKLAQEMTNKYHEAREKLAELLRG